METASFHGVAVGPALGHPGSLVAGHTERFALMTARTPRRVAPSGPRMDRQPVVRVYVAGPDSAVMTVRAIRFRMARGAEPTVSGRYFAVPLQPPGSVVCRPHPTRGHQRSRGELRSHAPRLVREVTHGTFTARVSGGRPSHLVTAKAPLHPRQLVSSRQLELSYRPVALSASDRTLCVGAVGKVHARRRNRKPFDRAWVAVHVSQVTVATLRDQLVGRRGHCLEVRVIGPVALVADLRLRQDPITGSIARCGRGVARDAREGLPFHVQPVVEAQGQFLPREDDGGGSTVPGTSPGRTKRKRHLRVSRKRREAVHDREDGRSRVSGRGTRPGCLRARSHRTKKAEGRTCNAEDGKESRAQSVHVTPPVKSTR